MDQRTTYAHDRLSALHDHADLQMYGPDLLIGDVQTVVAALASAERDLSQLRIRVWNRTLTATASTETADYVAAAFDKAER